MLLLGDINKGLADYRTSPDALLIDVREQDEFAAGHIPGAINVPLSVIDKITIPKEKHLFLYCLRGTRSRRAAGILKRMGYRNVRSIGGIKNYRDPIAEGRS